MDLSPAVRLAPIRFALAVALTVAMFIINEQIPRLFVSSWTSYKLFVVGSVIVAGVVIVATRGRVALPRPTAPWSERPWYETTARTFAATLIVMAAFVPLILMAERWWPDVPGAAGDAPWAPGYQVFVRAPVSEEFVWRGVVLGALCRLVPTRVAIAMSTVAFALIHFDQGYRAGLLSTIAGGFVFAIAAIRTGRLWLPIVLHSIYNNHLIAPLALPLVVGAWALYVAAQSPDAPSNGREMAHWAGGHIRLWFQQLQQATSTTTWPHHLDGS